MPISLSNYGKTLFFFFMNEMGYEMYEVKGRNAISVVKHRKQ